MYSTKKDKNKEKMEGTELNEQMLYVLIYLRGTSYSKGRKCRKGDEDALDRLVKAKLVWHVGENQPERSGQYSLTEKGNALYRSFVTIVCIASTPNSVTW